MNDTSLFKRRLHHFKASRRSYLSLKILAFLFVISIFGNLICNHKPLLLQYQGNVYFPIFFTYPETEFDGFFETEADYKDPYIRNKISAAPNWVFVGSHSLWTNRN